MFSFEVMMYVYVINVWVGNFKVYGIKVSKSCIHIINYKIKCMMDFGKYCSFTV